MMKTDYPAIFTEKSKILIKLNSNKVSEKIKTVNFILDIHPETKKIFGLEILNLAEQLGLKYSNLEEFESSKGVCYETEDDVAYIKFERNEYTFSKTKTAKGSILVDDLGGIVGFEIEKNYSH